MLLDPFHVLRRAGQLMGGELRDVDLGTFDREASIYIARGGRALEGGRQEVYLLERLQVRVLEPSLAKKITGWFSRRVHRSERDRKAIFLPRHEMNIGLGPRVLAM
jgi:hypothetical protein